MECKGAVSCALATQRGTADKTVDNPLSNDLLWIVDTEVIMALVSTSLRVVAIRLPPRSVFILDLILTLELIPRLILVSCQFRTLNPNRLELAKPPA